MFLEKKAKKQKEEVKEAHKVNQENHPFSQKNLANNRYSQYNNHGNVLTLNRNCRIVSYNSKYVQGVEIKETTMAVGRDVIVLVVTMKTIHKIKKDPAFTSPLSLKIL